MNKKKIAMMIFLLMAYRRRSLRTGKRDGGYQRSHKDGHKLLRSRYETHLYHRSRSRLDWGNQGL